MKEKEVIFRSRHWWRVPGKIIWLQWEAGPDMQVFLYLSQGGLWEGMASFDENGEFKEAILKRRGWIFPSGMFHLVDKEKPLSFPISKEEKEELITATEGMAVMFVPKKLEFPRGQVKPFHEFAMTERNGI